MVAVPATLALIAALSGFGAGGDVDSDPLIELELVVLSADEQSARAIPVVDFLEDGDVLDVSVIGGTDNAAGSVQQCVRIPTGLAGCTNRYPIRFDDRGRSRFQFRLDDPGGCGPGATCVLVVDDFDGRREASATLVFGRAAPVPTTTTTEIAPTPVGGRGDRLADPGHDVRRLAIGLSVAAALLLAAWAIILTVDWRPPSEADTPDLDVVEL